MVLKKTEGIEGERWFSLFVKTTGTVRTVCERKLIP